MKILIIARYFSPYNHIASIRLTKLAKYLNRSGHDITVLTALNNDKVLDPILIEDEKELNNIIRADNSKLFKKIYNTVYGAYKAGTASSTTTVAENSADGPPKKASFFDNLKDFVRRWMYIYDNIDFARQSQKMFSKNNTEFDVIISSYGPFSSHILGAHYKRANRKSFWIADFRDAFDTNTNKFGRNWVDRLKRKICAFANHVTAVSQGVVDELDFPPTIPYTVITNGYDPEDMEKIFINGTKEKKFRLAYPGQIYTNKSDLSPIFRALCELSKENRIHMKDIQLDYAGPHFEKLYLQAKKYDCTDILVDHGFVDRSHSLKMQKESNVLLLASWNNVGNTGIVTGKFLEYLMINKPIACVISGNLANSALKEMINAANAGVCCEEASGETDFELLKEFIYNQYLFAIGLKEYCYTPNEENKKQYTYMNKAKEFEALFFQ